MSGPRICCGVMPVSAADTVSSSCVAALATPIVEQAPAQVLPTPAIPVPAAAVPEPDHVVLSTRDSPDLTLTPGMPDAARFMVENRGTRAVNLTLTVDGVPESWLAD